MLKQMLIARKIEQARGQMTELISKRDGEIAEKRKAIQLREEELEKALEEVTEETQEEFDQMANEFEAQADTVREEENAITAQITELEGQIADLERQLSEIGTPDTTPTEDRSADPVPTKKRKDEYHMMTRTFKRLNDTAIESLFAREEVKAFAARLREMGTQKRAVTGGELLIPEILLPLLREVAAENSKLMPYINVQNVSGTSRQTIMGTIPEAVWTEQYGKINELTLGFDAVEMDGYKVASFIPVPNALLEDNDVNLVDQVLYAIGCSIALGVDKAILYGTGVKMPLGIVKRLAQDAQPADYTGRPWADLHTSNIQTITAGNSTGIKLFQTLVTGFGAAKNKFGATRKFWAMNSTTKTKLISEAMNFNSAAAIASGVSNEMPVIGGAIVELDFIPDNVIIAGWGDLYCLAQRAGTALAVSTDYRFVEDQTVFKGTARYDGKPVIAEAFVAFGINAAVVSDAAVEFAQDTANG